MNIKILPTVVLLGLFAGAAGLAVYAQDSESDTDSSKEPETTEPQAEAPVPDDDEFIPSEEIQADEELPFPVNI